MTLIFETVIGADPRNRFAKNWRWAIPEFYRVQIGQRWSKAKRTWISSKAYCFHDGCMLYDHAGGYNPSRLDGVQYAIQVIRADKTSVDYRWYKATNGALEPIDDGLRGSTQAQFVNMLQFGPTSPSASSPDENG